MAGIDDELRVMFKNFAENTKQTESDLELLDDVIDDVVAYVATQQQELLDRVMGEVIGEDQKAVRDAPEIEKLLHNSKRRIDHRNQLREQQRSAIKKIQGELK